MIYFFAIIIGFAAATSQMSREENKTWVAFFKQTADFEIATKRNTSSPATLQAELETFAARFNEMKPLLDAKSPTLARRAQTALNKAQTKLDTAESFPGVKSAEIQAALSGLPKHPVMPLPARMGHQVPLAKQFYCLQALMQNGGQIPARVGGEQIVYEKEQQAFYMRTNYNGEPGVFIYTLDGVFYLQDREAKARRCMEKFGGKTYLNLDMNKDEGVQGRTLVFSSTDSFTEVNARGAKPGQAPSEGCQIVPTVPGNEFNHLNDVADHMAAEMSDAYLKTLSDLPRKWVQHQKGKPYTRPNEDNLLLALKTCQNSGVHRAKMASAIDKILATKGEAPVETTIETEQ